MNIIAMKTEKFKVLHVIMCHGYCDEKSYCWYIASNDEYYVSINVEH